MEINQSKLDWRLGYDFPSPVSMQERCGGRDDLQTGLYIGDDDELVPPGLESEIPIPERNMLRFNNDWQGVFLNILVQLWPRKTNPFAVKRCLGRTPRVNTNVLLIFVETERLWNITKIPLLLSYIYIFCFFSRTIRIRRRETINPGDEGARWMKGERAAPSFVTFVPVGKFMSAELLTRLTYKLHVQHGIGPRYTI